MEIETLITAQRVAELLAVSDSLVYEMARSGELPCVAIRGCIRFEPTAIRNYIAATRSRDLA